MNKPNLPKDVKYILDLLYENGYEGYIVGGCVRDAIMGIEPHDWDITTSAKPEEVKKIFDHTFDTGIKHGTVTVVLNKENYEITTYRIEGEYEDCRHPKDVSFTTDLHEDLLRRDFTMNAIAYNDKDGYVDIFGGIDDIGRKIIKGVGVPEERFQEDALRMLRALRFSAQLGFDIEENTKKALIENAGLIEKISRERIREELLKLILSLHYEKAILLWETGLLKYISNEIYECTYLNKEKIVESFAMCRNEPSVAMALLLRYQPVEKIKDIMKDLRFDTKTLKQTDIICRYIHEKTPENPFEVRKMASKIGTENLYLLIKAKKYIGDILAENAENILNEVVEKKQCLSIKDLAVTGEDLKNMGISQGKTMGEVLNNLLEYVLENPDKNEKVILENLANNLVI